MDANGSSRFWGRSAGTRERLIHAAAEPRSEPGGAAGDSREAADASDRVREEEHLRRSSVGGGEGIQHSGPVCVTLGGRGGAQVSEERSEIPLRRVEEEGGNRRKEEVWSAAAKLLM